MVPQLRLLFFAGLVGPTSTSLVAEAKEQLLRTSDWVTPSGQLRQYPQDVPAHEVTRPAMTLPVVLPLSEITKKFLQNLSPCSHCRSFKRFGGVHDGGYVMCTDTMAHESLTAVYSYGISGEDQWGMDVAKTYNIPLFEYDCENTNAPEPYPGVQVVFNKKCVVSTTTDASHTTLGEQLAENHHDGAKEGSLVMKMDIEGAEWDLFANLPKAVINQFQQIVVEFHHLGQQAKHGLYLQAIGNILSAGFVVAHLHGNNIIHPTQLQAGVLSTNAGMIHFGADQIPDVLEITFVKEARDDRPCMVSYSLPQDSRNGADFPELDEPILPVPSNHESKKKASSSTASGAGGFSPAKAKKAFGKLKLPPLALDKLKLLVNGLKHDVDNVTKTHLT